MKIKLIIFVTFISIQLKAQNFNYPLLNEKAKTIQKLIPYNWLVKDSCTGDLNNDSKKDIVIIYEYKDSVWIVNNYEDTVLCKPRMMGIYFRNKNNYVLQTQSNSFILNNDTPYLEDPYVGIKIKNNQLIISYQLFYTAGSWWMTNVDYYFKLIANRFVLVQYYESDFHRATQETQKYEVDFIQKRYTITKEILLEDTHPEEEDLKEEKDEEPVFETEIEEKTFDLPHLKTIEELKRPFEWYFEERFMI